MKIHALQKEHELPLPPLLPVQARSFSSLLYHNENLVVVILFYISYVVNGTKVTERGKKRRNLISEAEKERAQTEKEKMKN